jgi:hypothetical protein
MQHLKLFLLLIQHFSCTKVSSPPALETLPFQGDFAAPITHFGCCRLQANGFTKTIISDSRISELFAREILAKGSVNHPEFKNC